MKLSEFNKASLEEKAKFIEQFTGNTGPKPGAVNVMVFEKYIIWVYCNPVGNLENAEVELWENQEQKSDALKLLQGRTFVCLNITDLFGTKTPISKMVFKKRLN